MCNVYFQNSFPHTTYLTFITFQEENRALVVIATDLIVEKISENSLKDWASSVKARFRDKNVTLLIYGFNEYFRSEKNARERINAANVRGDNPSRRDINRVGNPVSKYDFEEALVRLSLDSIVDHMTFRWVYTQSGG